MANCVFCYRSLTDLPTVKLRDKGCDSINRASDERKSDIRVIPGQEVHVECRRDFIHKRNIIGTDRNSNRISKCSTRSSDTFDFKRKCLFCGQDAKVNHRKRGYDVHPVRILSLQKSLEVICSENRRWDF